MTDVRPIRVAYADPPYLGMAARYSVPGTPEYHPDAARWDSLDEHAALLRRLDDEFPDGWAYSLSATTLRSILPLAAEGVRVLAWCKTWASWRPGLWPAYAFEPVLARVYSRGRLRHRETPRDWIACPVAQGVGFFGAKPPEFSRWLFNVFALGEHPGDEFVDLFPGSGAVTRAWDEFRARPATLKDGQQGALFAQDGAA